MCLSSGVAVGSLWWTLCRERGVDVARERDILDRREFLQDLAVLAQRLPARGGHPRQRYRHRAILHSCSECVLPTHSTAASLALCAASRASCFLSRATCSSILRCSVATFCRWARSCGRQTWVTMGCLLSQQRTTPQRGAGRVRIRRWRPWRPPRGRSSPRGSRCRS